MADPRPDGPGRRSRPWLLLPLVGALAACSAGQDREPPAGPAPGVGRREEPSTGARGEVVTGLDRAILHVHGAGNRDTWFGSAERGAYRHDGRTLVRFGKEHGLAGDRVGGIREDAAGNLYFATDGGVSRFDGKAFRTLDVATDSSTTDWRLGKDDLWFAGPGDSGTVLRYDGVSLRRLEIPRTPAGEDHVARHPRSEFPNARYSPYDVFAIHRDRAGHVWFGTALLGACRYDGKSFLWIPETALRHGSFGTRSIVEDREGRFWFCSTARRFAVDAGAPGGPGFAALEGIRDPRDPDGAPLGGIMAAVVDRAGDLWMATYAEGVWRWDGRTATRFPVRDGDRDIALFSIHEDREGVLWLGTQESGPYRFRDGGFERFRP